MLIDSHCHLLSTEYDNLDEVIKRNLEGVNKLVINGYDLDTSVEAASLAKNNINVYAAVGIGPDGVNNVTDDDILKLEEIIKQEKIVAIGEIGLDYYWDKKNKNKQIDVFEKMLNLASKYNKPVIVHCREAFLDTYNILKKHDVKGIIHCFSGSLQMANEFIKLGFLIGVGGVVTFKNAKTIKEVVEGVKTENIALETDSPYLTPEPFRGKKNEPINLFLIALKIAEIKKESKEEIIEKTGRSVSKLLNI